MSAGLALLIVGLIVLLFVSFAGGALLMVAGIILIATGR